ncbi:hypothetical protein NQ318_008685 [Aromia moschata]|uniref:Uncharacterized protein n=1 Tax=Aromia moschata TaxID=1265417 RepID=A0AAV8XKM5_9CUCU|nr:hypothetical protein NQ318_008685 [Aromia moschata]
MFEELGTFKSNVWEWKYLRTDRGPARSWNNIFGCYCLTEVGHGSNTKGMRTTATYCEERECFILDSPDFEAAKCWSGGLGQGATHAVVYAQLILKNVNYGLHAFVVPFPNLQETKNKLQEAETQKNPIQQAPRSRTQKIQFNKQIHLDIRNTQQKLTWFNDDLHLPRQQECGKS